MKFVLMKKTYTNPFIIFGAGAIGVSLVGLFLLFSNVFLVEINYQLKKAPIVKKEKNVILQDALDEGFSVLIPRININAKVIPEVDPFDKNAYINALAEGVAHAKGTSLPDKPGNTFIFAHSTTANLLQVNRYNAIFYLLGKLRKDDLVYLVYKGEVYSYKINEIKVVDPAKVEFLSQGGSRKTLTLMTCWPPGTTLKRLLVFASPI